MPPIPRPTRRPEVSLIAFACLVISACASARQPTTASPLPNETVRPASLRTAHAGGARIVTPQRRQQCVPYARKHSGVQLRGDAWTWWDKAKGRYQRGRAPAVGSVLVLKRHGGSRGHLAVVTGVVGDREIIVNHANWLNRGRIHLDTPVRDVSRDNDWSAVRVWYTPGKVMGRSTYPAYGFIYPATQQAGP